MGIIFFETQESGFKTILTELHSALEQAGKDENGKTLVEIKVKGKDEKKLSIELDEIKELLEIIRLNLD
ncbi:hypothetical protein [Acinetobacter oleivorans]